MPISYAGDGSSFAATVPIIADGEPLSEKNLSPAPMTLTDQSAYLYRRLPRVYNYASSSFSYTYAGAGAPETTIAAGGKLDVAGVVTTDKIAVEAFCGVVVSAGSPVGFSVWIDAIDDVAGTPGVQTHVPGALFVTAAAFAGRFLHLKGLWTPTKAGTTRFFLNFDTNGAGGDTIALSNTAFNIVAVNYPQ